MTKELISLNKAKQGSEIKLEKISDNVRTNLIRLGLCVGDFVKCVAKVPGGPVVLEKGLQEIAIGQNYAKDIYISEKKD